MDFHVIQHALGLCPDSFSHIDVIDIMLMSHPLMILTKNHIKYCLMTFLVFINIK
jgi:hypothetical protein